MLKYLYSAHYARMYTAVGPKGVLMDFLLGALLMLFPFMYMWTRMRNAEYNAKARGEELDRHAKRYPTYQGWSITRGSYFLKSFDSGHTWYDVEPVDGGYRIIGEANPETVAYVLGLQALLADLRTHGPIDPTDTARVALAADAGLTITIAE